MCTLRVGCLFVLVLLLHLDEAAAMHEVPSPPAGQPTNCNWVALSADNLLGQRLGTIELRDGDLTAVFEHILSDRGVPVSYIEAEDHPPITLRLTNPTVRELLDALISQSPTYRYGFLHQHLVFYPRVPPYESLLAGMVLPALPRLSASYRMVKELKKRYSEFAKLQPPILVGDPQDFLFTDGVIVTKPTSVLDGLVQLLGNRPSACFSVTHKRWTGLSVSEGLSYLDLFYVRVLEKVEVKPILTLVRAGDVIPLSVRATFVAGGEQDVTSASCGTTYYAAYPERTAVDEKGVMRALAPGNAVIVVRNEMETISLPFTVVAGTTATAPHPGTK